MGEVGEKNSQSIERAAAQRNDARPFSIQPEAPEERGKSQDENTDRKRQGYLRNAPSKLFRQRDAENAPGIDGAERDLEKHSRDGDYPPIVCSHKLLLRKQRYRNTILWYCIVGGLVDLQVRHDQFRRRVSEPLRKRKLLIAIALEHFEKNQIGIAGVLDVMQQRFLHIAHV